MHRGCHIEVSRVGESGVDPVGDSNRRPARSGSSSSAASTAYWLVLIARSRSS